MKHDKSIFANLKSVINEPIDTPTQTITPIKVSALKDETAFTFYFPKKRLKRLRIKAAEDEKSLKELITEAIFKQYGI